MAITDHIALFARGALASPVPNKKKPGAPLQHYAEIALPPAAFQDLNEMLQACATANNVRILPTMKMGVVPNSQKGKPLPGIPGDWLILRASSQYAPECYDSMAALIDRTDPAAAGKIRAHFYSGKRVRIQVLPWFWTNEGGGFSWNLHAVMDAGEGGDRIPGLSAGANPEAFAKHAKTSAGAPAAASQPPAAPPAVTNAPAAAANPFAQGAAAANPFAQPAA